MLVRVRLFAALREIVGTDHLDLTLPPGSTPEIAWQELAGAHPTLQSRRSRIAAAINRRYATFDDPLQEGDEVVFIPPVSGG